MTARLDSSWYIRPPDVRESIAAGGIVVYVVDKKPQIALVREENYSEYILPKGQQENGETLEEAARREIGEEAGIQDLVPVVINSGSGNQGLTVSLPVIEYAKELGSSREALLRALVLSNLTAIHQKALIGKLSAFCGAVSAASGAGAGIAFLRGGDYRRICDTITNTIANVGGIVCDGAKPSCAAKIASAVDAAIMAQDMAFDGKVFSPGEGLVTDTVEGTIANIGRMGNVGMKGTDVEILRMMLDTSSC